MQSPARIYDCVVIGGGPGGLVAGIYLRRLRRRVLIVSQGASRAESIPKIQNLVGYSRGISGRALIRRLQLQYRKFGGEICIGRARLRRNGAGFQITAGSAQLRARKVILATGLKDIQPPFSNLQDLTSKGLVCYCPICDGFDHSKERIALLIDDSAGLRKARFMKGFSDDLLVVSNRGLKLSQPQKRILRRLAVPFRGAAVTAIKEISAHRLKLQFARGNSEVVNSLYILLGARVAQDAIRRIRRLKKTAGGYLVVNSHMETSIRGLYAVGDCVNGLAQISVAVGQAAVAATAVHNQLR